MLLSVNPIGVPLSSAHPLHREGNVFPGDAPIRCDTSPTSLCGAGLLCSARSLLRQFLAPTEVQRHNTQRNEFSRETVFRSIFCQRAIESVFALRWSSRLPEEEGRGGERVETEGDEEGGGRRERITKREQEEEDSPIRRHGDPNWSPATV